MKNYFLTFVRLLVISCLSQLIVKNETHAQVTLLKDINPGTGVSNPTIRGTVGPYVIFTAYSPAYGTELWTTDGTTAGTQILLDATSGSTTSSMASYIKYNGYLYYTSSSWGDLGEIYRTDGTPAGTGMFKDINPGSGASSAGNFVEYNGLLYFSATDGAQGSELWKSDGTVAGTVMVKSIRGGSASSFPTGLTVYNNKIYFSAIDNVNNGAELWQSDGTAAGTVLLKNINTAVAQGSSNPDMFTVVNGLLLFRADDGVHGQELWRTNGTAAGTVMVKDFDGAATSSTLRIFSKINPNQLLFWCNAGDGNPSLWTTDGYTTQQIKSGYGYNPFQIVFQNKLFFNFNGAGVGNELYSSDGTVAGTGLVKDINPGTTMSNPFFGIEANDFLYFQAQSANGNELYRTDGTSAGTVLVQDINPGSGNSFPEPQLVMGNKIFLAATTPATGNELFIMPAPVKLNIKLNTEGMYVGGGKSNPALYNSAMSTDTTIADSIYIAVHDISDPSVTLYSQKTTFDINGNTSIALPGQYYTENHYISVRHRNSLETWSKTPVTFNGVTTFSFKQ